MLKLFGILLLFYSSCVMCAWIKPSGILKPTNFLRPFVEPKNYLPRTLLNGGRPFSTETKFKPKFEHRIPRLAAIDHRMTPFNGYKNEVPPTFLQYSMSQQLVFEDQVSGSEFHQ